MKLTTKMLISLAFTPISIALAKPGDVIQSSFEGPLNLEVWKHWQASWNVERREQAVDFQLARGWDSEGSRFLELRYTRPLHNATAEFSVKHLRRTGEWEVSEISLPAFTIVGLQDESSTLFRLQTDDATDFSGKHVVSEIHFRVLSDNSEIFSETVHPMFVRGKNQLHFENEIDPHSAHAGQGTVVVGGASISDRGIGEWQGRLVNPLLSFMDRNLLLAGSAVGLHRHVQNQEMFFVESGSAVVQNGVAQTDGDTYRVERKWNSAGDIKETDAVRGSGGWLETRTLKAGQATVIVPDPDSKSTIYFNGISAESDVVFWTMGTRG